MKTLTLILALVASLLGFDAGAAVSVVGSNTNGLVGTNAFYQATNGMVIRVNNTKIAWPVYLTNSSTVTISTNADGSVYFTAAPSSTNNAVYGAISTTMNTVLTNGTNIAFTSAAIAQVASVTDTPKASLYIESSVGSGTFNLADITGSGALTALITTNAIQGIVPPLSRYYYTNQGATVSIVAGSAWNVAITGGMAGGGGGSGTVTSVAVTSSDITVGGSPITSSGTITLALPWSTNQFTDTNRFQLATNGIISMFTTFTNVAIDTNVFRATTNAMTVYENGLPVKWPVRVTNTATITWATNADGSLAATSIAGGTGTLTGVTNTGGGVSMISDSNSPIPIFKSLTNSTAGISFTDNLTNVGATLSANLLLWNSISTNVVTDTNRFQLATNGIISMFTSFTNTVNTNALTDTNRFQLATNGIISMFTTFTNVAITTNTLDKAPSLWRLLSYDAVEPTVVLIDMSLGSFFKLTLTKATTIRFTNISTAALTNDGRVVNLMLRQDASGTWGVGTEITNGIVGFSTTNLNVKTNATSIIMTSWMSNPFTNSQMYGSVVTNAY